MGNFGKQRPVIGTRPGMAAYRIAISCRDNCVYTLEPDISTFGKNGKLLE